MSVRSAGKFQVEAAWLKARLPVKFRNKNTYNIMQ